MLSIHLKPNLAVIRIGQNTLFELIKTDKNLYSLVEKEENSLNNNIKILCLKHLKNGNLFIEWIHNAYPVNIGLTNCSELFKSINTKIIAKKILKDATEAGIIRKYSSYWRVPKENLVDLYSYLQSTKEKG